ncbi:MAG TPA: copper resistance CopC family protein [Candidatus Limnocylindrales bacterium]
MTVTAPRRLLALVAALLAAGLLAGTALGHAALVSSSPADGATVTADQARSVTLTFDDALDPAKSHFELVNGSGATVATGKVGADAKTMTADGLSLDLDSYQARWTAAASDGDITRGIVSFTVSASPVGGSASAVAAIASSAPADPSPSSDSSSVMPPITAAAAFVLLVAVLLARRSRAVR